jgi:hypothetical protein
MSGPFWTYPEFWRGLLRGLATETLRQLDGASSEPEAKRPRRPRRPAQRSARRVEAPAEEVVYYPPYQPPPSIFPITVQTSAPAESVPSAGLNQSGEPRRFLKQCDARSAQTGRRCGLLEHGGRVSHRSGKEVFTEEAPNGATAFPDEQRLRDAAFQNPEGNVWRRS